MKAITSVKQVFESDNVIITKILQGNNNQVRIDAKTRYHVADKDNFFSKWVSFKHANKLSIDNYGKKLSDLNIFVY